MIFLSPFTSHGLRLMLLAEDSRAELELFFREFLRDGGVRVPRVRVYAGRGASWLTRAARAGAITLGRRVFVAPSCVGRRGGAATLRGRLLAHEVAHVLQYEREGAARFLLRYLREYLAGLRREGKCDAPGRAAAYLAISFEREAREAEAAFVAWRARRGRAGVGAEARP